MRQIQEIHNKTLSNHTIHSDGIQIILEARGIAKDRYSDERDLLRKPHFRSDAINLEPTLFDDLT